MSKLTTNKKICFVWVYAAKQQYKKHMNTYVVKFDEGTMRVQAKNEAEALSILAEWFECSAPLLQLI